MIIKTDPTIRTMQGKFPKSNLIMQNLFGKFHTHAKSYAKPKTSSVTAHQAIFKAESVAIFNCLKNSSEEFKNDLKLYASIFNKLFSKEDKLPMPYHNFFTALCYASQKSKGYDLTDLTIDNFGMKIDCTPTIKCMIKEGYLHNLPDAYFIDNNFMHEIISGDVIYCSPPSSTERSNFHSFITVSVDPTSTQKSEFQSSYEFFIPEKDEKRSEFESFYTFT